MSGTGLARGLFGNLLCLVNQVGDLFRCLCGAVGKNLLESVERSIVELEVSRCLRTRIVAIAFQFFGGCLTVVCSELTLDIAEWSCCRAVLIGCFLNTLRLGDWIVERAQNVLCACTFTEIINQNLIRQFRSLKECIWNRYLRFNTFSYRARYLCIVDDLRRHITNTGHERTNVGHWSCQVARNVGKVGNLTGNIGNSAGNGVGIVHQQILSLSLNCRTSAGNVGNLTGEVGNRASNGVGIINQQILGLTLEGRASADNISYSSSDGIRVINEKILDLTLYSGTRTGNIRELTGEVGECTG